MSNASDVGRLPFEAAAGRILFVDDNIALAENLAEIVENSGYQVAIAGSAEAAIDIVAAGGISAIVTDFRLPGLDGIDLIETVRRSGCGIPVAVMTAYADDALLERASRSDVRAVLSKPVELPRLVRLIAEFDQN